MEVSIQNEPKIFEAHLWKNLRMLSLEEKTSSFLINACIQGISIRNSLVYLILLDSFIRN